MVCSRPQCVSYLQLTRLSGTEFNDEVSFGDGLVVFGQSIGAATDSTGFDDSDGVLGCARILSSSFTYSNFRIAWALRPSQLGLSRRTRRKAFRQ